jgi:hypothetical protein
MQSPLKPQYIANENEHHADRKKEIAEKKSIEEGRHQKALADILAAAKSLLGSAAAGAAGAAGKPLNSSGEGNPRGGSGAHKCSGSGFNPNAVTRLILLRIASPRRPGAYQSTAQKFSATSTSAGDSDGVAITSTGTGKLKTREI